MNITIVGAGLMGHGLAQIFAVHGHQVRLTDLTDDILRKAVDSVQANLTLLAGNGMGSFEAIGPTLEAIHVTTDLREAASKAAFVIEAVAEVLELKQNLFRELDRLCPPEAILATNTSVMSITEIAARTERKGRVVGTHFWNPPYLVPLVEVVPGQETSPRTIDAAYDLLAAVGKHPVKVKRDVPGFVGNRLQHALWREAISIVDQGIADAATVDEVIKNGFGIRLPVLGPLENADMVGLDLTLQIHDYILKYLESAPGPAPVLKRKVEAGELGFKTGRGFHDWSRERMDECRKGLLEHLIRWNREHKA
jgi:3-hydroxybutyryl-CoA dehydrogenase